ncbi:MAG: aspartate aminotransferase family protein [Solirubrobacteraceae bacterium]
MHKTRQASLALMDRAVRFAPGGVHSGRRKIDPPFCVRRANGAYLEDLDGHRYIDYHAAWGAIVLGHADPRVGDAVRAAIEEKVLVGISTTELEVALTAKLCEHVPSVEKALLCNSGTEATFHAVRLARAVTGRERIIKFQGCYHGFHDYVLAGSAEEKGAGGARGRSSAGTLKAATDRTLVCRYNDIADVERTLEANRGEIAAVIVEPFAHNSASLAPRNGFLEGLRDLCDRHGTVLIFDEVITGFRHHVGGYQAIAGVTPDVTTMAKALGNGFPIAAVGGRADLMERFSTAPGGDVFVGGTFNGGAAGVSAALATIDALEDGSVHAHTYRLGERMRQGLRQIADRAGVPVTVAGHGSVFVMCFMEGPLETYDDFLRNDAQLFVRYRRKLLDRGVFEMPDHIGCRSHISAAHTEDDVDATLEAAEDALRAALREAGRTVAGV